MRVRLTGVILSMIISGVTSAEPLQPAGPGDFVAAAKGERHVDLHTLSNPRQIVVTHLDLDLTVDFDHHQLQGVVLLDFRRQPGCPPDAPWLSTRVT